MSARRLPAKAALRVFLLLASAPGTRKHVVRWVKGARDWWSGKKIAVETTKRKKAG
jgi:hypothetical protein